MFISVVYWFSSILFLGLLRKKLYFSTDFLFYIRDSNGLLDPWSTGGIMEDVNESVVSVIIPEGAHHLDLRSAEDADPDSVKAARIQHREHIKKWIVQYHKQS